MSEEKNQQTTIDTKIVLFAEDSEDRKKTVGMLQGHGFEVQTSANPHDKKILKQLGFQWKGDQLIYDKGKYDPHTLIITKQQLGELKNFADTLTSAMVKGFGGEKCDDEHVLDHSTSKEHKLDWREKFDGANKRHSVNVINLDNQMFHGGSMRPESVLDYTQTWHERVLKQAQLEANKGSPKKVIIFESNGPHTADMEYEFAAAGWDVKNIIAYPAAQGRFFPLTKLDPERIEQTYTELKEQLKRLGLKFTPPIYDERQYKRLEEWKIEIDPDVTPEKDVVLVIDESMFHALDYNFAGQLREALKQLGEPYASLNDRIIECRGPSSVLEEAEKIYAEHIEPQQAKRHVDKVKGSKSGGPAIGSKRTDPKQRDGGWAEGE